MRKFLTIFTLSLLAVSCIDNDYDLSDIDTDDIGIGDENSVFTCPLMTLRVAVADIVNEQGVSWPKPMSGCRTGCRTARRRST